MLTKRYQQENQMNKDEIEDYEGICYISLLREALQVAWFAVVIYGYSKVDIAIFSSGK